MLIAIDTHSDAYHAGQMVAPFLMAAVALIVLWTATRRWRHPQPVMFPEDVEGAIQLGRVRTRRIVLGTAVIVAAAIADAVVTGQASGDYGDAASKGPTTVTITAPTTLDNYRLMTGTIADQLRSTLGARLAGEPRQHVLNFYAAADDPTHPRLFVITDTSELDPRLAQDLATHSANYENTNFMAGAKVTDPKVMSTDPHGGEMQCGQNDQEAICIWTDAGSEGQFVTPLTSGVSIDELAALTAKFQASAER